MKIEITDSTKLENGNDLVVLRKESEINILVNKARAKLKNDKDLLAVPLGDNMWVVRDGYGDVGILKLDIQIE